MTALARSTLCLAALLAAGPALAGKDDAVGKPINTLVQAIKLERDELAFKQFASDEQGKRLVGDADWSKATAAQKKEFTELFNKLFARLGFPKFREYFQYLDAVNVGQTKTEGAKALADTVILINHPLKKQELKVKFELLKAAGAWKVVDAEVQGMGMDSMLKSIREGNELPKLLKDQGMEGLLKKMRETLKEEEAKQPKK